MEIYPIRDIPILLSLASCYGCQCAIMFCLGLYQEVWEKHLNFSAQEVSLISGLTLSFFRIPSPLIESLLEWFKIPIYVQLGSAGLAIGAGMLTLTFTTEFPFVLAASLLGVGFGCFLGILSTCTSIYMFFKDKQIPVFMSIISSVTGLAVIIVALTFEWLQTSLGWQSAFKYSSLLSVPFLLAAFILCPKVNPTLQENHENHKDPEQNSCELPIKDSNRQAVSGHLKEGKGSSCGEKPRKDADRKEQAESRWSAIYNSWRKVLLNISFACHWLSWSLVSGAFKATMVHEPQRIVQLGYTMKNSAESLAINGGIQFASRLTVGLLASANLVSVIKLSQFAKLFLAIATFVSVFYTNLVVQNGFMFIMGACGGIIYTTDIILVKDCLQEGRGIALSLMIFGDSAAAFIATTAAGYIVDVFKRYQTVFVFYSICFFVGASLSSILECTLKKKKCKTFEVSPLDENCDM